MQLLQSEVEFLVIFSIYRVFSETRVFHDLQHVTVNDASAITNTKLTKSK